MSLRIACDGESSSGKSTAAKLISKKYKLYCMNSGLLFRYASFLMIKDKPKNQINYIKKKFKNLNYNLLVNRNLHSQEISNHVAIIAKQKKIREIIRFFQKKILKKHNQICCEGRDQASVILKKNPRYDVAFYFKCNLKTASIRRWHDLKKKIPLKEVKKSLRIRTMLDKKRRHNPLKKMPDAVLIRTDILNKKAMIDKMSKEINKKLFLKYGRNFKTR
ncbi:(d)CMP kinase [Pelagibacteraceae bacterium]|nr:(d)CMP kinase [Pelagibacteraceae bacterium]